MTSVDYRGTGEHSPLLPTQADWNASSKLCAAPSPNSDDSPRSIDRAKRQHGHLRCIFNHFTLVSAFLFVIFYFSRANASDSKSADMDDYDPGAPFAPPNIQRLWGEYSPYYSVEKYQRPPGDCRLTQVNILHRHGTRYPSLNQAEKIPKTLLKLQAAEAYKHKNLQFLTNYTYDLGSAVLVPYGEKEQIKSGRKMFSRYKQLANRQNLPFVRVSGSAGTVLSAHRWTEGFGAVSGGVVRPPVSIEIPPYAGFNTTLHDGACPNANHSKAEAREWRNIYARPIADRLNSGAKGIPNPLTPKDVRLLMVLCVFETLAKEQYSPFCELFSEEEFGGLEYALDLGRYYSAGYGAPLGPVQGVGYINELLARLTDRPVRDNTQTNRTQDSDPETFPLGRGIYADFSHSTLMASVVSAMGLFNETGTNSSFDQGIMNPSKPNKHRAWVTSRILPFSAKLVVERMECGLSFAGRYDGAEGTDRARRREDQRERRRRREESGKGYSIYVRVLMNDAVQVDICGGTGEDGLCLLQDFVKSQEYAKENGKGDWEKCFT